MIKLEERRKRQATNVIESLIIGHANLQFDFWSPRLDKTTYAKYLVQYLRTYGVTWNIIVRLDKRVQARILVGNKTKKT